MSTPIQYVPLEDLAKSAELPAGGFALQVSNFSLVQFVQKNKPTSTKLRFSLVMAVDHPVFGQLSFGWDGCLAHKGPDPETGATTVVWGPPATRAGYRYLKTSWVNRAVYDLVLEAICKTEYVNVIGYNQESTAVNPHDINPDLPTLLDVL